MTIKSIAFSINYHLPPYRTVSISGACKEKQGEVTDA